MTIMRAGSGASAPLASPIWLVRHAATTWTGRAWCGRADPPLSRAGRLQAADLGRSLAMELPPGTVVLTSPARRALATAEAIAGAAGLSIATVPDLVEVDFGRIEGLTWGELSTRHAELAGRILRRARVDWPDGETAWAVTARAARAADRVRKHAHERPAVIVSHAAFLDALGAALGLPESAEAMRPGGIVRFVP